MRALPDMTQVRAWLGDRSDEFTDDDILNAAGLIASPDAIARYLKAPNQEREHLLYGGR